MNPNNYRSHASTVQIYTKKSDDESIPLAVPVVGLSSRNDDTRSTNASTVNGSMLRNRASTKNLSKKDRERRKDGEKSIYTIESLTSEVESVQMEINEVLATASQSETEFNAAESVLLAELDQLRERKKVDDQQRSQIRSEAKALEDSKRSLETTKVKVEKRYNQLQEEFNRKDARRQKWQQEISQSKDTLEKLDSDIEEAKIEAMKRIEDIKTNISTCQAELFALEEETKKLATDCRRVECQRTATLKAIENCAERTDKTTGIVHSDFLEDSVLSNELVDQRLKDVLKTDVDIDATLEDGWQRAQKDLEMRYLDVKQRYEEAYHAYYEAVNKYDNSLRSSSNNSLVLDSLNAAATAQGNKRSRSQRKNKSLPLNISEMSVADNSFSPPPPMAPPTLANNSPHRSHSDLYYPSGLSIDTSTSLMNNSNNPSSGSNRGSGESSTRSQLMNDHDNLMSPDVDMLLPSNLFSNADDVHEPIPPPYSNNLFDDSNSETAGGRPSGSILGNVLQQPGQGRTSSFGSGTSPKPSLLSMRDQYNDCGTASPILPSSPQGSFQTFPLFHRATAPNSFTSPPPAPPPPTNGNTPYMQTQQQQQKTSPPNTAKKLSNMFFFGRRSDGRTTEHQTDNALFHPSSGMGADTWSVNSNEIAPIGSRRRTGSYSSLGNNSNSFLGPWNRDTVNPADNNSLLLAPSHSNNGSTVSLESSKFGGVLNGSSISLEPTTSSLWKQQNAYSDNESTSVPQVLVNDHEYNPQDQLDNELEDAIHDSGRSVDSKGSAGSGGMGNKFSKGFAGLFSSSSNNNPNDKLPVNTEKSIASLFGKSSDDEESRENIIQKSMRSFSVRKSSNSSTSSTTHNGKFKVRSLSFFGSKKDHLKEDNNEAIVEEDADMDIKEFLADDRDNDDDDDDDDDLPHQRSLNVQN